MAGEAQVMAMAKNVGDGTSAFTELTRIDGTPDLLTTVALQRQTIAAALYPCAHWTERPRAMRSVTTAHTLIAVTCATPRHPHGRGCSRKVAALGLDVKRPTRSGRRRSTMHAVVRSGNAP